MALEKWWIASGKSCVLPREFAQNVFRAGISGIDLQLLLQLFFCLLGEVRALDLAWKAAAEPGENECPDSADFASRIFR